MDLFKSKNMLALGLSGMMTVGTTHAATTDDQLDGEAAIVAISGPNVRVTLYDGIATVVGIAQSNAEAGEIESRLAALDGVEHVINLIASPEELLTNSP